MKYGWKAGLHVESGVEWRWMRRWRARLQRLLRVVLFYPLPRALQLISLFAVGCLLFAFCCLLFAVCFLCDSAEETCQTSFTIVNGHNGMRCEGCTRWAELEWNVLGKQNRKKIKGFDCRVKGETSHPGFRSQAAGGKSDEWFF